MLEGGVLDHHAMPWLAMLDGVSMMMNEHGVAEGPSLLRWQSEGRLSYSFSTVDPFGPSPF